MTFISHFGIHGEYFQNGLLLAHRDWIEEIINNSTKIEHPPKFKTHSDFGSDDIKAFLSQPKLPPCNEVTNINPWKLLSVVFYPRKREKIVKLKCKGVHAGLQNGACFAEILDYVERNNFSNMWQEAFKRWHNSFKVHNCKGSCPPEKYENDEVGSILPNDVALLEVIRRVYACPIIDATSSLCRDCYSTKYNDQLNSLLDRPVDSAKSTLSHIDQALLAILFDDEIVLLKPYTEYSLRHALRFSPGFLEDTQCASKHMFITYQVFKAANELHQRGLALGDITLDEINIDLKGLVNVRPRLEANICNEVGETNVEHGTKEDPHSTVSSNILSSIVNMWIIGKLSNFDYLMFLNHIAGRTKDNPSYYPVLPWVRDFSSENGGWRDLSKSKYRLNKGDQQLDLTYEGQKAALAQKSRHNHDTDDEFLAKQRRSIEAPPHHISDVLSEITYYVYKVPFNNYPNMQVEQSGGPS